MWQHLTYKMRITEFYLKQASYIFIELATFIYIHVMSKIFCFKLIHLVLQIISLMLWSCLLL
jgi:hypothetical protein